MVTTKSFPTLEFPFQFLQRNDLTVFQGYERFIELLGGKVVICFRTRSADQLGKSELK